MYIIEQESGSVIESRNLFVSHTDGEKHYEEQRENVFTAQMIIQVNADKGMDLNMNENLMKLLGKVEILNSGGSSGRQYNRIVII